MEFGYSVEDKSFIPLTYMYAQTWYFKKRHSITKPMLSTLSYDTRQLQMKLMNLCTCVQIL